MRIKEKHVRLLAAIVVQNVCMRCRLSNLRFGQYSGVRNIGATTPFHPAHQPSHYPPRRYYWWIFQGLVKTLTSCLVARLHSLVEPRKRRDLRIFQGQIKGRKQKTTPEALTCIPISLVKNTVRQAYIHKSAQPLLRQLCILQRFPKKHKNKRPLNYYTGKFSKRNAVFLSCIFPTH